ncbi:MAG: hypothetical protein JST59_13735 [Actinobacteria bacterium]|nr:hypothetical protein [Actinomycetota bacterium]
MRSIRNSWPLAVVALAGLVAGCGGGDSRGAIVNVYVGAPLCAGARQELASHGVAAGHFTVAVRCLAPSDDLATDGSNSRRATADSSAVATLEPPGPQVKFSRAILGSAEIPLVTSVSAQNGMERILTAIEGAGDSGVRGSVLESLESN